MTERESILTFMRSVHVHWSMDVEAQTLLDTLITAIEAKADLPRPKSEPLTAAQLAEQGFVLVPGEPSPWGRNLDAPEPEPRWVGDKGTIPRKGGK